MKKISIPKLTAALFIINGIVGIIVFLMGIFYIGSLYAGGYFGEIPAIMISLGAFSEGSLFYLIIGYFILKRKSGAAIFGALLPTIIIIQVLVVMFLFAEIVPFELVDILLIAGVVAFKILLITLSIKCWKEFKVS